MKLNVGCGTDIREGYINIDKAPIKGVDMVFDINNELPFKDNSVDEIIAKDILEHTNDYISVLREFYRVLKPGARLYIQVPHFTSRNNYVDPTHKHLFSWETFRFFTTDSPRPYYFDFAFSGMKARITFENGPLNKIMEGLVNISNLTRYIYESSLLRAIPAFNIDIVLIK